VNGKVEKPLKTRREAACLACGRRTSRRDLLGESAMADGKGKEKVGSSSSSNPRVEKVLELVRSFVGVYVVLRIVARGDLAGETKVIFSHKSRKDGIEETNSKMAWMGDKLYTQALFGMLSRIP
jgi:hypothetical protein